MNTMRKCSTCETLFAGDLCPKCMAGFVQKPSDPSPAPGEDLPLKPGQTFHGLEILELLGRGGMGVVYKAKQPTLDRIVALKLLPQKMALDPDFQNRFIREAKALGSLNHPNIVAVYDFGAENGLFFFVMEFVDGVNLRQVFRDRKLTPEQSLKIVPQLCDALEYAHAEGVVHRDIKPENIMLDRKSRVKIADFGLAKLTGADQPAMLTMTNMVMGTPHYMAPEQVENPKQVDHRADIYSMGVVFYEMLTGELPLGRFEPPSKKVHVDVRLDDIVLKSLEKQPERRYQKASEVKEAVSRATSTTSVESYMPTVVTPVPGKKRPAWVPVVIAAILAAAAVPIGIVTLKRPNPTTTPTPNDPVATPPRPVEPPAPEPIDLARLHFGPEERPLRYRFAEAGKLLTRIPFPAKGPDDLDKLVKFLDGAGLQNVAREDLKEGYVSIWWGGATVAALVTPIAQRLETQFASQKTPMNRWTYRKGELLVLAYTWRRDERELFNALVSMTQKKLGLPPETPDVPIENLKIEKSDVAKGWLLNDEPAGDSRPNLAALHVFQAPENQGTVRVEIYRFDQPASAKAFEDKAAAQVPGIAPRVVQGARRVEFLRTGRVLVILALHSPKVGGFEKVAQHFREWMGYPGRTFETIVPTAGELPDGYTFDKIQTETRTILESLRLEDVRASDVAQAWRATFKPHGSVVLLELKESQARYAVENELKKRGAAEDSDVWVFGVEGPDDETLDALENRMREKFGWDPNHPRPLELSRARLQPSDLPEGFTLANEQLDRRSYSCDIRGPDFVLPCRMMQTFDYGVVEKMRREWPSKPGDLLLVKDTVIVHVAGPGAAWATLDRLETMLRKKMRLGPPEAEDFGLGSWQLPKGSIYLERPSEAGPNPGTRKPRSADVKGLWRGVVDPSETQVEVMELGDSAQAEGAAARLRAPNPGAVQFLAVYTKGPIVASVIQNGKRDEAAFQAIADLMRAKLRVKAP